MGSSKKLFAMLLFGMVRGTCVYSCKQSKRNLHAFIGVVALWLAYLLTIVLAIAHKPPSVGLGRKGCRPGSCSFRLQGATLSVLGLGMVWGFRCTVWGSWRCSSLGGDAGCLASGISDMGVAANVLGVEFRRERRLPSDTEKP